MNGISGLLGSLAVLSLCAAGLSAIVGLRGLRDRLLRIGLLLLLLTIFIPYATQSIRAAVSNLAGSMEYGSNAPSPFMVFLVGAGHVVLAAVLLRRRLRGSEAARRDAEAVDRTRGRERLRLPPGEGG